MPRLRGPYRCDLAGVGAVGQPVEEFGADYASAVAALVLFVVGAGFAGDQEHDAGAHGDGLGQAAGEAGVGGVQAEAVEVYRYVRRDGAARQLAVPAGIEAATLQRAGDWGWRGRGERRGDAAFDALGRWGRERCCGCGFNRFGLGARRVERRDRGGDLVPQVGLLC